VDRNRLERLTRQTAVVLWLVVAATVVMGRPASTTEIASLIP